MLEVKPIVVRGIRTVVHEAGEGEAVVFVHGNPGPLDDWEPIAHEAARFARVVAMDLPGFGRAERPRDFAYSVNAFGELLGELLDQINVRGRVHLVAHDFGGAWATAWAASHRERVASITLISAPVVPGFVWHWAARLWYTPVINGLFQLVSTRGLIKAVMRRENPRPLPEEFLARVAGYADVAQKRRVLRIYRQARDPAATFAPIADALRAIDPPACVVWGAQDPYARPVHLEATRQLFSRAEAHLVDRAGHWPFVDEPERVTAIVCDFLRRQISAAASTATTPA